MKAFYPHRSHSPGNFAPLGLALALVVVAISNVEDTEDGIILAGRKVVEALFVVTEGGIVLDAGATESRMDFEK